jgi:hypothetical protein
VDTWGKKFLKKMGLRRVVWLGVVQTMIALELGLNFLACLSRPDFITTLVCTLAIFFLSDSSDLNRDRFRWLPVFLLVSILYDLVWLLFLQQMNSELQEGGIEHTVKQFSLIISYLSMAFKVPLFLVLWKVSVNFLIDVKQAVEAPRLIKIMKIVEEFAPDEYSLEGPFQGNDLQS